MALSVGVEITIWKIKRPILLQYLAALNQKQCYTAACHTVQVALILTAQGRHKICRSPSGQARQGRATLIYSLTVMRPLKKGLRSMKITFGASAATALW